MSRVAEPLQYALTKLMAALEKTNTGLNENRVRLEGKIERTRESQEALILKIRADLAKVEAEL